MTGGPGRARMERRFGPPGVGRREIEVGGQAYSLPEVMARLGLAFEGCRTIDGFELGAGHFAVRYYDAEDQTVVAYEFDAGFRCVAETRVHVAEWVGEDALHSATWTTTGDGGPPWTSS